MLSHAFPYFRDASPRESNIWTLSLFVVNPFPITGTDQQSSQIITRLMAQDIIELAL